MTTDILLGIYGNSLKALEKLVSDVPDARFAEMPGGIRNHPAWTLTHLCVSTDFCLTCLGEQGVSPSGWAELARPGTVPQADRSMYPAGAELLSMLRKQHDLVVQGVRTAAPGHFDLPAPERVRERAPTMGHIVTYFLASHEQNHIGQLQAWKRAAGLAK